VQVLFLLAALTGFLLVLLIVLILYQGYRALQELVDAYLKSGLSPVVVEDEEIEEGVKNCS